MRLISAYTINVDGILCYTGLPTMADDLTIEHHNGKQYSFMKREFTLHEIFALKDCPEDKVSLIHGSALAESMGMFFIKIGNCNRVFDYR